LWIELYKEIEADIAAAGRLAENYRQLAASGDPVEASLAHLRATYAQRLAKINEKIKSFNLLVPIARLQKPLFVVDEEVEKLRRAATEAHRRTRKISVCFCVLLWLLWRSYG